MLALDSSNIHYMSMQSHIDYLRDGGWRAKSDDPRRGGASQTGRLNEGGGGKNFGLFLSS